MKIGIKHLVVTGVVVGGMTLTPLVMAYASSPPSTVSSPGILYVSHAGSPSNTDANCSDATYTSVQSAISAAPAGATVYLCDTTPFTESVVITQSVKLTGVPGATIQSSGSPNTTFFSSQGLQTPNSVVTVLGGANVVIRGLTIEGPFNNAGCSVQDFGILQLGAGLTQILNDSVENIGAADQQGLGGCQYGVGIEIGSEYWPTDTGSYPGTLVNFTGDANVLGTTVSGYQKNGVTADGPGTTIQIDHLTANGGGPTNVIGRNGLQISDGATGKVYNSYLFGNEYTGTGFNGSAAGILVYGGCGSPTSNGVVIRHNVLVDNDMGVYDGNFNASCSAGASSPTNNQVVNNMVVKSNGETNNAPTADAAGNNYTSYQVGIADTGDGDQIHGNMIYGTPTGTTDAAYGPVTTPNGPFLDPLDLVTFPPTNVSALNNVFDGQPLPNS